MWKSDDFECGNCGAVFDEMYKADRMNEVQCPECGSFDLAKLLAAPRLNAFSMMSPEHQRDSLMRRSRKHTQKEVDKEPERWGAAGVARSSRKIQSGYKKTS
jgi:putative FmdB family regulatory protein